MKLGSSANFAGTKYFIHSLNCRFQMERLLTFSYLPLERFSKIHINLAICQWITRSLVAAQTTRRKIPIKTLNEHCGMCGWSSCFVVGIWGILMFRIMDAEYCNVDTPIIVKDDILKICPRNLFCGKALRPQISKLQTTVWSLVSGQHLKLKWAFEQ